MYVLRGITGSCVLLFLTICMMHGQAQQDALDLRYTLGQYSSYVDLCIQAFQGSHALIESFNDQVDHYYAHSPHEAYARFYLDNTQGGLPIFENKELDSQILVLEKNYLAVLKASENLPEKEQRIFVQYLGQLQSYVDSLWAMDQGLQEHTAVRAYFSEPELGTIRSFLERFEVLYEDLSITKDKFHFEITTANAVFGIPGKGNLYSQRKAVLAPILGSARSILWAIRQGNKKLVQKQLDSLIQGKKGLVEMKAEYFKGEKGMRHFVDQVNMFIDFTQKFLSQELPPIQTRKEDIAYDYYNHHLLPIFNAAEQGLVDFYNHWVIKHPENGQVPLAKEVKWMKPIFPKQAYHLAPSKLLASLKHAPLNHLTVLVDVSGSMNQAGKLSMMKTALKDFLPYLREEDQLAMVTFSGLAEVSLPSTYMVEKKETIKAIDALSCEGKSDPLEGTKLAYHLAQTHLEEGGNNRVILVTDGGFEMAPEFLKIIEKNAYEGVPMSVLFIGRANRKMEMRLQKLAEIGGGNFGSVNQGNLLAHLLWEAGAKPLE